jgi:hypothetical protein
VKPNRQLTRSIRGLARKQLRSSKLLWKEYRQVRLRWWRRALFGPRFLWLFYVVAVYVFLAQSKIPEFPLAILTLYSTGTIMTRASQLLNGLHCSWDLAFFMHYPVSDREFFNYTWRAFLRSSLLVWIYSLVAFGYIAANASLGGEIWLAAIASATLQWASVLTLAVIAALFPVPKATPVFLFCYSLIFASPFIPNHLLATFNDALIWLPTGWISYVFDKGVLHGNNNAWYGLVPIVMLLSLFLPAIKVLRRSYEEAELEYPDLSMPAEADEKATFAPAHDEADWLRSGEHLPMERAIPDVQLHSVNWNSAGWLERGARRWLSERERAIAEFLCGGELGLWSRQWKRGLKVAFVGTAVLLIPAHIPTNVYFGLGIIATMFGMPLLGGSWKGMQLRSIGGTAIPAYAGFPLSYTENSRVLAKVNLLRIAGWTPLLVSYAALLAWRTGSPPTIGILVGAEIVLLILLTQPLAIVGVHSYGTNDSKRINLHALLAFIAALFLGIVFLVCIGIFFVAAFWAPGGEKLIPAVIALCGMLFSSSLIWLCYRFLYDRGRIDLMRNPD